MSSEELIYVKNMKMTLVMIQRKSFKVACNICLDLQSFLLKKETVFTTFEQNKFF